MNHPKMTTRGRTIAGLIAVVIALALPKRVECDGGDTRDCGHLNVLHHWCTSYEVEPLGFYMIEHVVHRDVGFAYSAGEECR
ncbi:MAG: hypothetical protein NT062_31350 [Proteobacteria bacterium]|nr:hypothetical protein [Pseudomonadota bacterium]